MFSKVMIKEFWTTVLALKPLRESNESHGNPREFSHNSVLWPPKDPSRCPWFGLNAEPWCQPLGGWSVGSFPALLTRKLAENGAKQRSRPPDEIARHFLQPWESGPSCWRSPSAGKRPGKSLTERKESPASSSSVSISFKSVPSRRNEIERDGRKREEGRGREKGGEGWKETGRAEENRRDRPAGGWGEGKGGGRNQGGREGRRKGLSKVCSSSQQWQLPRTCCSRRLGPWNPTTKLTFTLFLLLSLPGGSCSRLGAPSWKDKGAHKPSDFLLRTQFLYSKLKPGRLKPWSQPPWVGKC